MQSFIIDQALYGYDSGHRLLATSRRLNTRSQHTALQLSDRSTSTNHIPPSGYLTGYPLSDDSVYVLSRTWAALEMNRPGCVWTHSLLIAFTDLAQILDMDQLATLFRRPNASRDYASYANPLEFEPSLVSSNPRIETPLARSIITALYSKPEEQVFLTVDRQAETETVVTAIWSQQWPRLRRSFRFCTLTTSDRSTPDHRFDLQLSSSEFQRTSLWRESQQSKIPHDIRPGTWIDICLQDLTASQHPLRDFLRRAGGDLTKGRTRFADLCELYGHISSEKEIPAIERTLEYVEHQLPPDEGRLLRKSAIENALRQAVFLNDHSLVTILPHLPKNFTDFSKDTASKLARRYWGIDPNILLAPATPNEIREELRQITKEITPDDAWETMQRSANLFKAILATKPEVLVLPQMWSGETDKASIEQLKHVHAQSLKVRILKTVISVNRRDLAQIIVDRMGSEFLLESLIRGNEEISETGIHFISEALTQSNDVGQTISKYLLDIENPLSKRLIHALTNQIQPSDAVDGKKKESDPWAIAWTTSTGDLDAHSTDAVYIFFVERTFLLASPASFSLLRIAFDPLFDRLSRYEVSYDNRVRLSHQLDSSNWWDWSYARRFMRTIANFTVAVELPEADLLALTQNEQRLIKLLYMIADTKRGRRYLKALKRKAKGHFPYMEIFE